MAESSPFSSHLDTNYAPSDGEVYILKEFIENQRASVEELTRKIQEAKVAATQMKAQRAAYLKSIEDHSKLLSPIRRISDDVLSLIFTFRLETMDPTKPERRPGLSRGQISVVLSHVSMLWRDLALRNPLLWSHVRVKIPPFRRINYATRARFMMWAEKMEALNDKIQVWFHRSSPLPIYLSLEDGGADVVTAKSQFGSHTQPFYLSVMETICQASPRVRQLHYDIHVPFLSEHVAHLFERSPDSFPDLQTIVVNIDDETSESNGVMDTYLARMASGTLFTAPSLRRLEVFGDWGDIGVAKAGSAFSLYESLEELVFQADIIGDNELFNESHALDLLRVLPNLLVCEFAIRSFYHTTLSHVDVIKASRLTSLTLHEGPVAEGFASSLDLPPLRSLHLDPDCIEDMDRHVYAREHNGILQLFSKFGYQLKRVTMHIDSVPQPSFSQCLSHLNDIEWLKLLDYGYCWGPTSSQPAVFALAQLSIPGVCPKLRELRMEHITNVGDDPAEAMLVDFISGRRDVQGGCEDETGTRTHRHATCVEQIRKVKIMFTDRERVDIRAELEGRGLDLDGFCLDLAHLC